MEREEAGEKLNREGVEKIRSCFVAKKANQITVKRSFGKISPSPYLHKIT